METILSIAFVALSVALTVVNLRMVRRDRERARRMAEMLDLANGALAAGSGPRVIASGTIPADSELGRYLEKIFAQIPCTCPNCEEERRIAHAEQERGEK